MKNNSHRHDKSYKQYRTNTSRKQSQTKLQHNQDKEIFIKDIEKRLCISKSVASNLVKRMEKNGFVELVTSDKDKRYKYVHLTDLGKKKARDVKHFREAIHEQLLEGISKEDAETAFRVFHQIRKNLEKNKE